MNIKSILKKHLSQIIPSVIAIVSAGAFLLTSKVNQEKKKDEINEIVKSIEFKHAVSEIIESVINQNGGIKDQIIGTNNGLKHGSEKMSHLEKTDEEDYRELSGKITTNLNEIHQVENRVNEKIITVYRDMYTKKQIC